MLNGFKLPTSKRAQIIDITETVKNCVKDSKIEEGIAIVYSPHTTAGITINEGADPDVRTDINSALERIVPRDWNFLHAEGNSDSHIKTSMMNPGQTLIISEGKLVLGTWQAIYFCEFDGPRSRTFY
ncbi:secondary thiamine-phosphate synthase enzyme YjbQ, partial [Candidatus Calescamantes bacterium]|nr:secondary thiamine-phosphate synthase enzyme YjbQ [Candidatus Calescamantes bacterium]